MEIRFKKGTQVRAKPEVVYGELERVREMGDGDISLQLLVDESKPKDSVLHGEFEWRNVHAANKYRLEQGRYLVKSLEIEREDVPATRVYESVRVVEIAEPEAKPKVRHVFRTTEDIMADPDTRDELLGKAIRDALAYKKRYHGLQELAKVFAAFDEVLMEIQA
jgi:hypothetical protein